MSDDDELLVQIRTGTIDAYAELVRRHQAQVFGIVRAYERDPLRREELAQDVFLKAWRSLDQFQIGRAPFQHWLSRLAVRVALDHLRERHRRAREVLLADLGPGALDWLQREAAPAKLGAGEAREILDRIMPVLSPAEHIVITLREIEGRSVKEVAELTGSSGVAVRVRALRARAKLRQALGAWGRKEAGR
ncbi:MAG: RNA polymerase sigma factor [Opitutales bacterium]